MPQSIQTGELAARSAAVLTNSAVAAKVMNVFDIPEGIVSVEVSFTLGSLTNGIFNPQVSMDSSTWFDLSDPGALTLTATGTKAFPCVCKGWKFFRVTATGTGTVTSSSATINYHWQKAGGAFY